MADLLIAYFVKFGDKPCCGGDLKLYLPILDTTESEKFFQQTLKSINFDESIDRLPKTVCDIFIQSVSLKIIVHCMLFSILYV